MDREKLAAYRIQCLIEVHEDYDFPEFLRILRRLLGLKRKRICEDTGITETRLFYLEHGRFKRRLANDELKLISDYYGIDKNLMKEKINVFIKSGKAKVQGDKD